MKINYSCRNSLLSFFLILLAALPNPAFAGADNAAIFISINKASFLNPEYLEIVVTADPAGKNFNAGEVSLSFPPDILQLDNIIFTASSCQIIARQTIDNAGGKINFICGTTDNDINYQISLARIKFNKINTGMADLSLSGSSLIGADGLGTKITTAAESHNIFIVK